MRQKCSTITARIKLVVYDSRGLSAAFSVTVGHNFSRESLHLEGHDVSEKEQMPSVDGDTVRLHNVRDFLGNDYPSCLHTQRVEHLNKSED